MSQKLPVNGFEWVKGISGLNKKLKKFIRFIKNMMKKVMKDTFLKQIWNTLKIYMIWIVTYHFYQKE